MRVAINGFGRVGRSVFKIAFERPGIDIIAINDIGNPNTLAYLLKHDSTYGVYKHQVSTSKDMLIVNDKKITVSSYASPVHLPWREMDVDVVIESTGLFCKAEGELGGYEDHIKAGAQKVILTAPAEDDTAQTVVLGVNDNFETTATIFSNASCTTNALAPLLKVLHDNFGVEGGFVTTVHAYTNDQTILDLAHHDLLRSRAASLNIIPTKTAESFMIGKVIPELDGKINDMAMRVPTPVGSAVDLVANLSTEISVEEVNSAFEKASEQDYKGIIEYSQARLVSSDLRGNSHSVVFDAHCTMAGNGGFIKIMGWYDNEFGYSTRIVDLVQKLS